MPTLLLVRHAKSGYPDGVADHDRPLSARGLRDAAALGRELARRDLVPGLALVSTAARAWTTWETAAAELPVPVEVAGRGDLYLASSLVLASAAAALPAGVRTAALVGHNPGIAECAELLAGDGLGLLLAREGFPTATVAVVDVPGEWTALTPGGSGTRLVDLVVARG